MHVCNPSTQEVETRELQVLSQTGLQSDPDSRRPKKEREGREGGREGKDEINPLKYILLLVASFLFGHMKSQCRRTPIFDHWKLGCLVDFLLPRNPQNYYMA
jgi:hypothetical protein